MTPLTGAGPKSRRLSLFGAKLARLASSGGPSTAHLERLREAFRRVQAALPPIEREIGARYSLCTSLLDPLSDASESLLRESECLLKLAIGQTDGDLITDGTASLLGPPMQFLDDWRSEVISGLKDLEACAEVLAQLQGSESTLQMLVAPLHYMQVMFRVESARLSEDFRQVFASLTEQIAVVHNEVRTTFGQQFQIVGTTIHTLDGITAAIRTQAHTLETDLETRKGQIAGSLSVLRSELEKNATRDVALSSSSRAIAEAIGDLVVALQSHDIITQRLDHISASINEARDALHTSPESVENAKGFYLLTVQRSQLRGVHQDLQRSELALMKALQTIRDHVDSLDNGCMLLTEFKQVTVGVNGSIQVSIDMVVDLRQLMESVVTCSRDFYSSIEPIGNLTTKLTGALERLSSKMRLIALNAQVQAVQIGAGTGLEVLAAHIAEVSGKTSQLAESISRDIHRLVSTVQSLSQSFLAISDKGNEHLDMLRTKGGHHEERLHDVRDRTLHKLSLVGGAADKIQQLTARLTGEGKARETVIQALHKVLSDLEEELADLGRAFKDQVQHHAHELGSHRYSMVAEHEAHADALRSLGVSLTSETHLSHEPNVDGANAETIDSQVELF